MIPCWGSRPDLDRGDADVPLNGAPTTNVDMHKTDDLSVLQRIIAASGYLWILCLVPMLLNRGNHFALFHGKQGLLLFVSWFLWWVVSWAIALIPFVGTFIVWAGNAAFGLASFAGLVQALRGREWHIPVLGDYARKIVF